MEEDVVCEPVRDKHSFLLSLYPLCLYIFLCFVTILCAFFVSIHLPKLGTRVRLIWGDEAFTEINFTPIFLFMAYNVYVATVSSLNV